MKKYLMRITALLSLLVMAFPVMAQEEATTPAGEGVTIFLLLVGVGILVFVGFWLSGREAAPESE